MKWFDSDFLTFFSQLRKNNNREWFEKNKTRYENSVKIPFEAFIAELLKKISKIDGTIKSTPKESIFRIYRDVRFSKDKTPYKDHASAIMGPGGKKGMEDLGLYLAINDKEIMIASGAYMPEKEFLHRIRLQIASNSKAFSKVINDKNFKKLYKTIAGEKSKRLLPELVEDSVKEPLLYNKQFYIQASLKSSLTTSPKLIEELMKYFKAAQPLNQFLRKAQHGK